MHKVTLYYECPRELDLMVHYGKLDRFARAYGALDSLLDSDIHVSMRYRPFSLADGDSPFYTVHLMSNEPTAITQVADEYFEQVGLPKFVDGKISSGKILTDLVESHGKQLKQIPFLSRAFSRLYVRDRT